MVRGILKCLPRAGGRSRVGVVSARRDIERGGDHAIFELLNAKTGRVAPRRAHVTTSSVVGWAGKDLNVRGKADRRDQRTGANGVVVPKSKARPARDQTDWT